MAHRTEIALGGLIRCIDTIDHVIYDAELTAPFSIFPTGMIFDRILFDMGANTLFFYIWGYTDERHYFLKHEGRDYGEDTEDNENYSVAAFVDISFAHGMFVCSDIDYNYDWLQPYYEEAAKKAYEANRYKL